MREFAIDAIGTALVVVNDKGFVVPMGAFDMRVRDRSVGFPAIVLPIVGVGTLALVVVQERIRTELGLVVHAEEFLVLLHRMQQSNLQLGV